MVPKYVFRPFPSLCVYGSMGVWMYRWMNGCMLMWSNTRVAFSLGGTWYFEEGILTKSCKNVASHLFFLVSLCFPPRKQVLCYYTGLKPKLKSNMVSLPRLLGSWSAMATSGGFHGGGAQEWMVYKGKSHENGWWRGVPQFQEASVSTCQHRPCHRFRCPNDYSKTQGSLSATRSHGQSPSWQKWPVLEITLADGKLPMCHYICLVKTLEHHPMFINFWYTQWFEEHHTLRLQWVRNISFLISNVDKNHELQWYSPTSCTKHAPHRMTKPFPALVSHVFQVFPSPTMARNAGQTHAVLGSAWADNTWTPSRSGCLGLQSAHRLRWVKTEDHRSHHFRQCRWYRWYQDEFTRYVEVIWVCCKSSTNLRTHLMPSQDTECVGQVSCQRVAQKKADATRATGCGGEVGFFGDHSGPKLMIHIFNIHYIASCYIALCYIN